MQNRREVMAASAAVAAAAAAAPAVSAAMEAAAPVADADLIADAASVGLLIVPDAGEAFPELATLDADAQASLTLLAPRTAQG